MTTQTHYVLNVRRLKSSEKPAEGEVVYSMAQKNYAVKLKGREHLGIVPMRVLNGLLKNSLESLASIGLSNMTIKGQL
jgi:hypothetical protein